MGLVDKVKKILFDEEEVEISQNSEKDSLKKSLGKGFVDHSVEDTPKEDEDTIKEIVIPPYDEKDEIEDTKEVKKFNFPDNFVFDDDDMVGSRYKGEKTKDEKEYQEDEEKSEPVKENRRVDYSEVVKEKQGEKKPFRVSPTISPVYGIIDKNYVREESTEPKVVSIPPKKRTFGPVSYNDDGDIGELDTPKRKSEVIKEEIKEVSTTINEMIEEAIDDKVEIEEIKTSGIENEYIDNNNIEDAFESTSEFRQIKENDERIEKEEYVSDDEVTVNEIHSNKDENLDDTIETDLFNLIDSMYSSDDTSEDE